MIPLNGTVRKNDDLPQREFLRLKNKALRNIHTEDGALGNLPDNGRLRLVDCFHQTGSQNLAKAD